MLFLLNDKVFKIADGASIMNEAGLPMTFATKSSVSQIIIAIQTAFMECPELITKEPVKAAALCWVLNSKSKANCAMFVPSVQKLKSPSQIAYRLANVNLTLLGTLNAMQEQGRLTPRVINENVWSKIAA